MKKLIMKKLNKLTTTTALAALLGAGLAFAPHAAFAAGSKNPGVPLLMKVSNHGAPKANPCAPKAANPCAPKAMSAGTNQSGTAAKANALDYPRFNPNYLKGIGSN